MARREKTVPFEAALEELERVVERLEHGELPLEESIEAFERGIGLVRRLGERLTDIEQRVETLLASYEDGNDDEDAEESGD